jgi:hypothetical protein
MTKEHFRLLCHDYAAALERYTAAADKLCAMLSDCDAPIGIKERTAIASHRNLEIHLHSEYQKVREKLLEAVSAGYGKVKG